MADRFRFTPVRRRAPLQWLLGTVLTAKPVLRASTVAFRVDPPLENSSKLLIVPGSRRIRIFDFESGVTRSVIKEGFDRSSMETEIALRTFEKGPFLNLIRHDLDGMWFEEPIIGGYPLPRIPPWWDRRALEQRAMDLLISWSSAKASSVNADEHVDLLRTTADSVFARMRALFPEYASVFHSALVDQLVERASGPGSIPVSETHGDFQPGNVQIAKDRRVLHILDWEFVGRRFLYYDLLSYGLHLRNPGGFMRKTMRFLSSADAGAASPFIPEVGSSAWRRRAFALLALEEIVRAGKDAASGPYRRPPHNLHGFCKQLHELLDRGE